MNKCVAMNDSIENKSNKVLIEMYQGLKESICMVCLQNESIMNRVRGIVDFVHL